MGKRSKRNSSRNLDKIKIKNSTRVSLVMLSLIIFSVSSACLYNSIFKNDVTKIHENIYTYTNDYKSDYVVNVKNNSFITEDSLPSGQTYISDLIDSIDMDIDYKYSGSKDSSINYSYKIDAIIGANYNNDGSDYSVWNKTYNLKTSELLQANNIINIDEKININYKKYNQEVKSFKQTLGMNVDAYLYIKLTVNTLTVANHQEVKNEYTSNFSISLGDKVAVVEGKNNDTKVGSVKQENKFTQSSIDIPKLLISSIFVIISLYTMYFIRYKTKKFNAIKNEFKLELNRILKSCQDRIVMVKNNVDSETETIIDVNDFGELIKLSEELYKPILCWISDDLEEQQAWFSILSNKVRYRFILKK